MKLLLNTHFPGCQVGGKVSNISGDASAINTSVLPDIITPEKTTWAINSFSPYKSAGPDSIQPIMLQKMGVNGTNLLCDIYWPA